jgi:membrane dipeptidase
MRQTLCRATTPDDILQAKRLQKHCLYLSGNGVPLTEQWNSPEEELLYIRVFFQLGIRMMHLTYNRRNMLGDGCSEGANAGLSDFGRLVVAEMNRVGVIVDVAHAGHQTSLEAARASSKPIMASHTGCSSINAHARCKPDEVLRAIADKEGVVGVCCIPAFLGGTGDIRAMLDHVDYIVKTVGVGHVAIGTDTAYQPPEAAAGPKIAWPKSRRAWENFWAPDDALFKPEWNRPEQLHSLEWTNWPLFTVGLVQRGYSDDDIQKIIGGNVLRVARSNLA